MDWARAAARTRDLDHLTDVLGTHRVNRAAGTAEVEMGMLFQRRDIETGERCRCHPGMPEDDLHDYGASCRCTRTGEERRASYLAALNGIHKFWESPAGQRSQAASHATDQELQTWLANHSGIVVHGHWPGRLNIGPVEMAGVASISLKDRLTGASDEDSGRLCPSGRQRDHRPGAQHRCVAR